MYILTWFLSKTSKLEVKTSNYMYRTRRVKRLVKYAIHGIFMNEPNLQTGACVPRILCYK